MKFTIDDRPAVFATKPLPVRRMETAAAGLPDGKMVTNPQLAALTGLGMGTIATHAYHIAAELKVKHRNKNYYGNKKTIQAFREAYNL